jgi:hypothetical protein
MNSAYFIFKHTSTSGEIYGSGFSRQCDCSLMQFFHSRPGSATSGSMDTGGFHVCDVCPFVGHITGLGYPPLVHY